MGIPDASAVAVIGTVSAPEFAKAVNEMHTHDATSVSDNHADAIPMKYLVRTVVVGSLLAVVAWALVYIVTERETYSTHASSSNWGISKDSPLRPYR